MKIAVTDKGSGIAHAFARAIGATISGRFVNIPKSKGEGYLTGFNWGSGLRMMIRNYHLKEEVTIERTNELAEGQEDVIFMLSGVLPLPLKTSEQLLPEQASLFICRHAVTSVIAMPSYTVFGSVTIAVSKEYLQQLFGKIEHPVVAGMLQAGGNFVLETGITAAIVHTAGQMLNQPVPESLESFYYKLKCEELLCHIVALLMQREALPAANMHLNDVKAIYAVKEHLLLHLHQPPQIAVLASRAGMSEPKLRKLFKQTFGKGVFEYYQSARMHRAAQLLRNRQHTVSEAGYQLGFTNLSHFARVFELHTGMKPKKYASKK